VSSGSLNEISLTAALFVGGESRRMGVDKATLLFQGEPLWMRQLKILRGLHPERILLSARSRPPWCPEEVEVVPDEQPSRGPLSGLVAALERSQTTHLLALAIDLPHMSTEHLQRLWLQAAPDVSVIPQRDRHYEPLAAMYARNVQSPAKQALLRNRLSLQSLSQELVVNGTASIYQVSASESQLYRNVNRPEDLI
jgi:molybdopterin-guanine dinucleotide biosynthesis protein A